MWGSVLEKLLWPVLCCLVSWISRTYLCTFQILIVMASILWTHSGENSDNRQHKFNQNLATWKWLIYTYRLKAYIFNSLLKRIYWQSSWGLGLARRDYPRQTWSSSSSTPTMMRRQSKVLTLKTLLLSCFLLYFEGNYTINFGNKQS